MKKNLCIMLEIVMVINVLSICSSADTKAIIPDLFDQIETDSYVAINSELDYNYYSVKIEQLDEEIKSIKRAIPYLDKNSVEYTNYSLQQIENEKQLKLCEFEIDNFESIRIQNIKKVEYEILCTYIDIYKQKQQRDLYKNKLEIFKKKLELLKTLYKYGKITETELENCEIECLNIENKIKQTINNINLSFTNISTFFNIQFNAKKYDMNPFALKNKKIDVTKIEENFLNNNVELLRLKKQLSIERDYLDEFCKLYPSNSNEYKLQKNVLDKLELQFNEKESKYKLFLAQKLISYESKIDELGVSKKQENQLNKQRKNLQALYDAEKISFIDYSNTYVGISEKLNEISTIKLEIYIAELQLGYLNDGISV